MNTLDLGRYRVVEGSASSHCCFEWSVVDSASDEDGYPVCECFEKKDADAICAALNGQYSEFDRLMENSHV